MYHSLSTSANMLFAVLLSTQMPSETSFIRETLYAITCGVFCQDDDEIWVNNNENDCVYEIVNDRL